jgi:hypothetical protein
MPPSINVAAGLLTHHLHYPVGCPLEDGALSGDCWDDHEDDLDGDDDDEVDYTGV